MEEEFGNSEAFCWLIGHARQFGFRLSYHRENRYGIAYEPWHWFFEGNAQGKFSRRKKSARLIGGVGSFEKFSNGIGVGLYGWRLMKLCKRFYARH